MLPILLLVLIGTVSTALVYSDHLAATNAVREASRYGAAADASSPAAWAISVKDRLEQTYFNADTAADNQICVRLITSGGTPVSGASWVGGDCGQAPSVPSGMAAGSCAVQVWLTKPGHIDLAVLPSIDLDIRAESVSYYGRRLGTTCTA